MHLDFFDMKDQNNALARWKLIQVWNSTMRIFRLLRDSKTRNMASLSPDSPAIALGGLVICFLNVF